MTYNLDNTKAETKKRPLASAIKTFLPFLGKEKGLVLLSLVAILVNSGLNLAAPIIIGHTIDTYVIGKNFPGVITFACLLFVMYILASGAQFVQTRVMGGVSQRLLFTIRNTIFTKLQSLPVAFFNENKAGDLISRINNDTDKLNQFFSQALMQFIGNLFMIIGAGIAIVLINPRLGLATLLPAAGLLLLTKGLSAWIKHRNTKSLEALGSMSANIQESLQNFKVIVAFHRRDYFRDRFQMVNNANYEASIGAGIANNVFTPLYGLCANLAILIVIAYGIHLISVELLTIGVLISFLTYTTRFYDPLKQIASLWTSFQQAMAGWDRISGILRLESNLPHTQETSSDSHHEALLSFEHVGFSYTNDKAVLREVNLRLLQGKTYALVGPTGGGKTTTASLMARLYDPTEGTIYLNGKPLTSYSDSERTKMIGFILQEPFLFTGTVAENLVYGNPELAHVTTDALQTLLQKEGLFHLLDRFEQGLATPISANGESLSLGQRQLLAFIRAILRKPDILILDEATANIDTVTEQLLEEVLAKLPKHTTRVIIAHRLNTIENADTIYFVNGGTVTEAGSMEHAVDMLLHHHRQS